MALPPPEPGATALVTGASSGIGSEIARELAKRGHGVTLSARREDRLRALADELRAAHGIRAEAIACDVSDPASRAALVAELAERGLDVEILVNNAGFGSAGQFHELDADTELRMVRTNVEAVVGLTRVFLPQMVGRGRGAILNTASVAGFQPLPRQATYAATKAFVLSFSEALAQEVGGDGITVTALCPGPVKTEFVEGVGGDEAVSSAPGFVWESAADVAKAGVSGLAKGKRVVIPGAFSRAGALMGQHAPRSVLLPLMSRLNPLGRD